MKLNQGRKSCYLTVPSRRITTQLIRKPLCLSKAGESAALCPFSHFAAFAASNQISASMR